MSTPTVNAGKSEKNVRDEHPLFILDHAGSLNRKTINHPLYATKLTWNADDKTNGNGVTSTSSIQSQEKVSRPNRSAPSGAGARRRSFLSQLSNSVSNRYYSHDDNSEYSANISAMKPGIISESLRAALGLSETELPLYIYRMRHLGYPPGHLQDVCRRRSGILVFTKDRREISTSGRILEEGEVNEEENELVYDFDRLIDFPGFNTELLPGTLDEHERLKFPPMLAEQSKEAMKQRLLSGSRRSSIEPNNYSEVFVGVSESPPNHFENGSVGSAESFSDKKKDAWLSEMGLSAADGWCIVDAFSEDENPESDDVLKTEQTERLRDTYHQDISLHNSTEKSICTDSLQNQSSVLEDQRSLCMEIDDSISMSSPKHAEKYGNSINVSSGTPVYLRTTYGSILPDASRFAAGLSELIPFENLPNSTGSFQRMRKILGQARLKT